MGTGNARVVHESITETHFPLLPSSNMRPPQATCNMCILKHRKIDTQHVCMDCSDTISNNVRRSTIETRPGPGSKRTQLPRAEKVHLTIFIPRLPVTACTISSIVTWNILEYFKTPRLLSVDEEIGLFCETRTRGLFGRFTFSLNLRVSRVSGIKYGVFQQTDNFLVCSDFTTLSIDTAKSVHSKCTFPCTFGSQQFIKTETPFLPMTISRYDVSTKRQRQNRKMLTIVWGENMNKVSGHELCLRRTKNIQKQIGVSNALSSCIHNHTHACTLLHDVDFFPCVGISVDRLLANLYTIANQGDMRPTWYNSTPKQFARHMNKNMFTKLGNDGLYHLLMIETKHSISVTNSNCIDDWLRQFFDRINLAIIGTIPKAKAKEDGQIPHNVLILVNKKVHVRISHIRRIDNVSLSSTNCMRNEVALLRKGMKDSAGYSWSSVGGHNVVKKVLTNTFELPLKYRHLFTRYRSVKKNVLLFGPPGTGKTLIAKVVASQGNMKFICVKGPEILNMYIGESERVVREIFRTASENLPCLLFFDEVESIAPRRYNAEAMLTSRIVSQLAIELDISHPIPDLLILGATNRPDLIDISILRPKRFDRLLYVGIDTTLTRRVQLLEALTRHMNLPSNFELENVARHCSPICSGADIYGACIKAWISAVKRHVNVRSVNEHSEVVISVLNEDLLASLATMSPTLTKRELKLYDDLKEAYDPIHSI